MIHLVLGLGNPGDEYAATRHNAGFRVVDELARRLGVRVDRLDCHTLTAQVELPPAATRAPAAAAAVGTAAEAAVGIAADEPADAAVAALRPVVVAVEASESALLPPDPAFGAGDPAASAPVTVLLAKPQTYMNRSGYAARCLVERHGLDPAAVLVVYDEINLPLGRLRLRRGGRPAGHRGLESIVENLRTDQVARLRIGIAPPPTEAPVAGENLPDYVLAAFTPAEEEALEPVIRQAADACETWLRHGIDAAMNRFNGA